MHVRSSVLEPAPPRSARAAVAGRSAEGPARDPLQQDVFEQKQFAELYTLQLLPRQTLSHSSSL